MGKRNHRRKVERICYEGQTPKRIYTRNQAVNAAANTRKQASRDDIVAFECGYRHHWHIGRSRLEEHP